jgi:hypothetical protein
VRAAAEFWSAQVRILDQGHHDLTLQPDCSAAAAELLSWLESSVVAGAGAPAPAAACQVAAGGGAAVVVGATQGVGAASAAVDVSVYV